MPAPELLPRAERSAPVVGQIETCWRETLERLEPDERERRRAGRGRPRVLPALALWGGLRGCVRRGCSSQVALWRLLRRGDRWCYPRVAVTDQAAYQRLATAGEAPLRRLFEQISRVWAERLAPYRDDTLAPFATDVVACDDTTLDQVARTRPILGSVPAGDDRLRPGKLSAAFDLRRQQFQRVEHTEQPDRNEQVGAWALRAALARGRLILADLGYRGFRWFEALTDRG